MERRRPTLKAVAKAARVSLGTASNSLRGDSRTASATRERVRAVAEKLGYRPDPMFAAIRARGRVRRAGGLPIAWVWQCESGLRKRPVRHLEAARVRAEELGYRVDVYRMEDYPEPGRLSRVLRARGVVSVVLDVSDRPERVMEEDWSGFTVVACEVGSCPLPFALLRHDWHAMARIAYEKVWATGRRRIGALVRIHRPRMLDDAERVSGVVAAHLGLTGKLPEVAPQAPEFGKAFDIRTWVLRERLEAVVGFPNVVLNELRTAGVGVPHEVAYAGLALSEGELGRVAGWDCTGGELGAACAELTDQLFRSGVKGRAGEGLVRVVSPRWTAGDSLPERG